MVTLTIRVTNQFKKDFKKIRKQGKDVQKIIRVVGLLRQGRTLAKKYRDHQLTGQYNMFRDCHIEPDWLLFYYVTDDELWLVRTGSHAELFRQ